MNGIPQSYILFGAVGLVALISLVAAFIFFFFVRRRNTLETILKDIARDYSLNRYTDKGASGYPETAGVVDGAYLRVRVAQGAEFGNLERSGSIVASLLFELPVETRIEVRRGSDFSEWHTPLPDDREPLRSGDIKPELTVYGARESVAAILSPDMQGRIANAFSGPGEWRLHVARRDGEIMWRSPGINVSRRELGSAIENLINLEKQFSESAT